SWRICCNWPSSPKVPWRAMKAISVSLGKVKSGPRTSTSLTCPPNDRSALATPAPVARETSRSDPGPPFRTAIFLPCRSIIVSRTLPDDLHFGLQIDPTPFPRGLLDFANQLKHLGGTGCAFVNDEITVHVGDTGVPDSQTLQAQLVDQFA